MNKEQLKFWVTCPDCQHKFGIPSETVFKYLNRVLDQYDKQFKGSSKKKRNQNQQQRRESQ